MMDLWKLTFSPALLWALLIVVLFLWARCSMLPREEPCEVRLLAGEGVNDINWEEEKERCFREGHAQGVEQTKSEYDAKGAQREKAHRQSLDNLRGELQTAQIQIGKQSGLISGQNQIIKNLRAEVARCNQEATGEAQPMIDDLKEKNQQLESKLQAETAGRLADRARFEDAYSREVQARQAEVQGRQADRAVFDECCGQLQQQLRQALQTLKLHQETDQAVQERYQLLYGGDLDVEMCDIDQEPVRALQQATEDHQRDQVMSDISHVELFQQERDKAIHDRHCAEQKCREALQENDCLLKQLQQLKDDQVCGGGSYSKLQQEKEQAEQNVQRLTKALQEKDQLLNKTLQEKELIEQGRLKDQAHWNSSYAQLAQEKDQAVQTMDKIKQDCLDQLAKRDRVLKKLRESFEDEQARSKSMNAQLQEKEVLLAQMSERLDLLEAQNAGLESRCRVITAENKELGTQLFETDMASVVDRESLAAALKSLGELQRKVNDLESLRGLRQARPRADGIRRRPITAATGRRNPRPVPDTGRLLAAVARLNIATERQELEGELPDAGGNPDGTASDGFMADRDEANSEGHGDARGQACDDPLPDYDSEEYEGKGEVPSEAMGEAMGDARGDAKGESSEDSSDASSEESEEP